MKIGICNDHRGLILKNNIVAYLKDNGYDVIDYGTDSEQSVDFPDYAFMLGDAIVSGGSTVINYDGYNFVDCSYIYLMLLYGLIILFVLIFAYVIAALIRREDIYFLYAIALVAINGMIAHHINRHKCYCIQKINIFSPY